MAALGLQCEADSCEDSESPLPEEAEEDDESKESKSGKKKGKGNEGGKKKGKGSEGGKGKNKGGKKKGKGSEADKRSSRAEAREKDFKEKQNGGDFKKCGGVGSCGKWLDLTSFHAGQGRCKDCSCNARSLQRCAVTQRLREELETITSDEKQHTALCRAFSKARDKAKKANEKVKFNIRTFQVDWKSREGTRKENEGELMWEAEYLEFAATAKAGFLTKSEAQKNWEGMRAQLPAYPHDYFGPRGFLRLFIPTRTRIIGFEEAVKERTFSQQEKLSMKATEEQVRERVRMVFDSSAGQDSGVNFEELMKKALHAFAGGGGAESSSGLSSEKEPGSFDGGDGGLLGIDVAELLKEVSLKQKLNKRKGLDNEDADDEAASGQSEKEDDGDDGKGKKQKTGGSKGTEPPGQSPEKSWLDASKVRRGERAYNDAVDNFLKGLREVETNMTDALAETRRAGVAKDSSVLGTLIGT